MGLKDFMCKKRTGKVTPLLKCFFAELLDTFMLVLVGCGAALNWKTQFDVTQVESEIKFRLN